MEGKVNHLETHTPEIRQRKSIEARVVEIENLFALPADQVVVPGDVAVKSNDSIRMAGLSGNTKLHQSLEGSIHRSTRHTGDPILDVFKKLIHCRVILAVEQGVEDDTALYC